MSVFEGVERVPAGFGPSAVTIGKFDGVHLGHQRILRILLERAAERSLASVAVTFDRHPLSVLDPARCPAPLASLAQKTELLEASGVDATLVLAFDEALRALSPREFVERVLVGALDARLVLVGDDFRFGARGAGDVAALREIGAEHGLEVEVVEDVVVGEGEEAVRASSTAVRQLLDAGRVEEAAVLLGRMPRIRSTVVRGAQRGRELGYPTANLHPSIEGYLPADGVYAVWVRVDGERYGAEASIGDNPTFEGVPARQAEVHLFDQQLDLYDRTLEVEFQAFQRPMVRFVSAEALIEQLRRDDDEIREALGLPPRRTT
ncbi:bifunctional riboflavin kinase/FAD synthetase [Homoserinibacter sp. YIM 151385]|uniref:bifunctional riboflavin kinase/FAD synthetase n=1 Tax=Homoserinibacter sp. YIM 151385 TaxID=2985506 RepID=UPI0022F0D2C5|nr:bifunctional riboflavin kinase/FAD synthetase [Homoserinibacter sp. YIM 151385]WBU38341.1 bifunctional riboflavin kinase/FAD synthetase [Homoserinibacter sp. YIM 151385]